MAQTDSKSTVVLGKFMDMTKEENPHRATIRPVPEEGTRPLWSVMIPAYNCAEYLRETLSSVLVQDPGPALMQIEVVDDHSTEDDPAAVVEELGKGRVGFYRQAENVGYIRNFETCLQRSRGRLIHLLHGDDYVRTGFYSKLQRAFEGDREVAAAYCRHIITDEHGHWERISPLEQPKSGVLADALDRISSRHPVQTPSIVVRRDIYEKLGGFDRRISSCGEDWEMWVRIASRYPFWFEVEPLAVYRSSSSSLSGKAMRTGQNIRDVRRAVEIIKPCLPVAQADELLDKAGKLWAFWGLHCAGKMLACGDRAGAIAQIREAVKCSRSLPVIAFMVRLFLEFGKRGIKRKARTGISFFTKQKI
jgi:hypothetical protein